MMVILIATASRPGLVVVEVLRTRGLLNGNCKGVGSVGVAHPKSFVLPLHFLHQKFHRNFLKSNYPTILKGVGGVEKVQNFLTTGCVAIWSNLQKI